MKPYEKLQRYWRETDAYMETIAVSHAQVETLEKRYGVRLPEDFRDYLLHLCPKDDFQGDGSTNTTTWWPLERIKNVVEELAQMDSNSGFGTEITDKIIARDAAKYIFFADYMIWMWAWAICCDESKNRGKVAVIGGSPDRFVAGNFGHFVEMYVEDKGGGKRLSS